MGHKQTTSPRCDAAERGVPSGSILFAVVSGKYVPSVYERCHGLNCANSYYSIINCVETCKIYFSEHFKEDLQQVCNVR